MTGAEIREARLGLGLTQALLASQLGVAVETVHRWEAEKINPTLRSQIALRSVLGKEESKPAKSKRRKS